MNKGILKMPFDKLMATLLFLLAAFLGHASLVVTEPKIIDLQFLNPLVTIGQNIELNCIVQDVEAQHMVYIHKQGVDRDSGQLKWYQLTTSDGRSQYPSIPYAFWINNKGNRLEFMMRVQNAEESMSGNYSCTVQSGNSDVLANKTAEVSVIVEPTSINIYVDGEAIQPNSTHLYKFSSTHNLQCIARGSNPAAKIDIWHGNQDLTRRATSVTVEKPIYGKPTSPEFPFLAPISRSVNLTIKNWRVDVTYEVAPVVCSARTSGHTVAKTVQFTPVIEDGPPHFICNDSYILPEDGNEDIGYEITCQVITKPPLTGATFGCEPRSMCNPFSAFPVHTWHPAEDTVYSGFLKNTGPTSSTNTTLSTSLEIFKGNMTLKIRIKKEGLIGRSYAFTAENVRGQAYHKVTIVNAAASMMVSAALCLTTIVLSILLV